MYPLTVNISTEHIAGTFYGGRGDLVFDRPTGPRVRSRSDAKAITRTRQIDYVREIIRSTGLTASRIAREIGRSTTTLTRFLADDYDGTLHPTVVQALADWSGIPFTDAEPAAQSRGFREEAVPYEPGPPGTVDPVAALIGQRYQAHGWLVKMDMPGVAVRKGDVVVVDQMAPPVPGDLVCCQFEDGMTVTTVFRIWHPPFLFGTGTDPTATKPELANEENRRIVGVVTDVVRSRARGG
jgi:hypothetical protein